MAKQKDVQLQFNCEQNLVGNDIYSLEILFKESKIRAKYAELPPIPEGKLISFSSELYSALLYSLKYHSMLDEKLLSWTEKLRYFIEINFMDLEKVIIARFKDNKNGSQEFLERLLIIMTIVAVKFKDLKYLNVVEKLLKHIKNAKNPVVKSCQFLFDQEIVQLKLPL